MAHCYDAVGSFYSCIYFCYFNYNNGYIYIYNTNTIYNCIISSLYFLKRNVNTKIYHLVILLVILLEILAPVIIIYHCITGEYSSYSNYAIVSLIVFTILATLLYHPLDITNYYKSIPFWANISLIGGLLLLLEN